MTVQFRNRPSRNQCRFSAYTRKTTSSYEFQRWLSPQGDSSSCSSWNKQFRSEFHPQPAIVAKKKGKYKKNPWYISYIQLSTWSCSNWGVRAERKLNQTKKSDPAKFGAKLSKRIPIINGKRSSRKVNPLFSGLVDNSINSLVDKDDHISVGNRITYYDN